MKKQLEKDLFVATENKKDSEICKKIKIQYCLTSKKCLTGTDRIAEFAKKFKYSNYVNIQGDEPIFNPKDLKKIVHETKKNPNLVLGGYCKIKKKSDFLNTSIPKIVFDKKKFLLYMSRSPIPGSKKKISEKLLDKFVFILILDICFIPFIKENLNFCWKILKTLSY